MTYCPLCRSYFFNTTGHICNATQTPVTQTPGTYTYTFPGYAPAYADNSSVLAELKTIRELLERVLGGMQP